MYQKVLLRIRQAVQPFCHDQVMAVLHEAKGAVGIDSVLFSVPFYESTF